MRTILAFFLSAPMALAEPEGAGPRPPVSTKYVPEFINDAMRDVLGFRDDTPGAMLYYAWTQPELRTSKVGNATIGWWSMTITARGHVGTQQYIGARSQTFLLTIENMRVSRILVVDTNWD